ncbi:MAG: hypothetical protein Q8P05_05430 [Candidatus Diapherotrites archaeon]|nr:hypothetical protein [Candidatus Diapherotrites archaeon]
MEDRISIMLAGLFGGAIAGFSCAAKNVGPGEVFDWRKFLPAMVWGAFLGLIAAGAGLNTNELETTGFSFVAYTFLNNIYKGIKSWLERR